uniref:Bifunctional lysine-specific demethylase and histidyl-hydroxylase n=1 Tax=Globodera rostochiensis TaxID=31243 RepID=A0A914HIU9_GLORO
MGKKDRKNSKSFRLLAQANDSVAISKQKKLEKDQQEKDIVEKFEERQNVDPAVSLKSLAASTTGYPSSTSTPMDRQSKRESKWRSDGRSAVHKTVREMVVEAGGKAESHRLKGKRKIICSPESSGKEQNLSINCEEKLETDEKGPSIKRMKVAIESDSDDTSSVEELADQNGQFSEEDMTDEDEEESLGGEPDDLEDEELEQADAADLKNGLEDEEEASSFFTSDESLEDEIEDDSDEGPLELEFTGYGTDEKSAKCLILEALEGYTIAASPFALFKFSEGVDHSVQVATKALQWITSPIDSQTFFSDFFQKRVFVVNRKAKDYFDGFFGTADFFEMLQKFDLGFGTDVNVALYEKGERTTLNGAEGERASAAAVWRHTGCGRSVQFVRPQRHNDNIWYLCDVLQELFCSFVGANCYLTPPKSSGFAPHWDDIDAFMLQVEGRKYWKVYAPASADDTLPLESSGNFAESDFEGREPTFEGWLEQGDTLYVPRGWTHQALTGDVHSLHVTVSVCRHHSFADFLEKASAEFVQTVVSSSKHLRHNLPPLLLDMGGVCKSDFSGEKMLQEKIIPITEIFARKFGQDFSSYVSSYIDLMAREFFRCALPPLLTLEEKAKICCGAEIGDSMDIGLETEVRLVRKHTQRLLFESAEKAFIVHRMDNSRSYEGSSENIVDFPTEFEDGFVVLIDSYPEWVKVRELGLKPRGANIELAKLLFGSGLLMLQRETARELLNGGEEKAQVGEEQNAEGGGKKSKKRRRRKDKLAKKDSGN